MPAQPQTPKRVLVSDALSEAAIRIFKDRGIEVDFRPELGKDRDALIREIGRMTASPSARPPR